MIQWVDIIDHFAKMVDVLEFVVDIKMVDISSKYSRREIAVMLFV